jgi:hypothetical protein
MQTANLRQIYAALPRTHLHLAPSLNLVVTTLGSTSGQAIGSLVIEHTRDNATGRSEYVGLVNDGIIYITIFFAIGMVVTQVLPRIVLRTRGPTEAQDAAATASAEASGGSG